jgi:hypothetical protein
MGEGVADNSGTVVGEPAFTDRGQEPAADPVHAPHGWTWDRADKRWRPSKQSPRRGPKAQRPPDSAPAPDAGAGRDPDPGWLSRDREDPRPARLRMEDIPRQVTDDIAGLAGLVGTPILAVLQQADPYCGTALAQSYEGIVDATIPLICRSEKVVAYFTGDKSDWLLWGKLAMALAPVARAVTEHHIIRTVEVVRDPETGAVSVKRVTRTQSEHGDHLQPQAQPSYVA